MNLWDLFPEFILRFNGILKLPYLAMLFYIYVVYTTIKNKGERTYLVSFLLLTLIASTIMLNSLGPQIGKIIPPFALLSVMAMPLIILIVNVFKRTYNLVHIWFIVAIAGWLHSLSWSVWLFALARS